MGGEIQRSTFLARMDKPVGGAVHRSLCIERQARRYKCLGCRLIQVALT